MSQFTEADSAVNRLSAAVTAFEKVLTEPEGTVVEMPVGAAQPSLAERLKRAIDAVTIKPAQAATQATTAAQQALASQQAAAQSAADASNSAAATGYVDAPFPDVWAPLSDDLRLLAGFAPADTITVAGTSYPLPTKSMTFTRSTTATYIDKSGVLKTAAINEPRFEREGLLMEGQSTNYILNSDDPSKWSGTAAGFGTKSTITDGATQAKTFDGVITATGMNNATVVVSSAITCVTGDFITLSCRFKSSYTDGFMLFRFDAPSGTNQGQVGLYFDGSVGNSPNASIVNATCIPGPDGYMYGTVTCKAPVDGAYVGRVYFMPKSGTIPVGSEVFIQTVQCEKNAVATSYIPTGAAEVTRVGDTCLLQCSANIGYRMLGDLFNRTVAFEVTLNKNGLAAGDYCELMAVLGGASYDTVLRLQSSKIESYRSGSSLTPTIAVTSSHPPLIYAQTIDINNKLTAYFNNQSGSRTAAPNIPSSIPTNMYFGNKSSVVYHVRNFRIWHRVLSDIQIKGLR